MRQVAPPRWTSAQLDSDRLTAIEVFRRERMQEPLEQYLEAFDGYRAAVEDLLETTVDLQRLSEVAIDVLTDPALLEAVRYLGGPPISADDLKVLSGVRSLAAGRLRADPETAVRVVETVLLGLDRRRFPWVAEDRTPTEAEREAAALASAALLASSRVSTNRKNEGKAAQELAVAEELELRGFTEVHPAGSISALALAPAPGEYCGEIVFGSRKADLVIGLLDHRKMPLECKVSNSATNSIKRLNNDAAVKAIEWIAQFGTAGVVPAAVLSGVFNLRHLEYAQDRGLTIFWAHSLHHLSDWIAETRSDGS